MIQFLRRHANFAAFVAVMAAVAAASVMVLHPARSLLIGFDAGAAVFLLITARMFTVTPDSALQQRVADNEPDHAWLSIFAIVVMVVVLTSLWVELSGAGGRRSAGVALGAITLALAWLFANTVAALHYAHLWYSDETGGGIDFPGKNTSPDYWDFAYFAFTIGMTFQVSDTQITHRTIRRGVLLHALVAFVYNMAVVALSVSLIAAILSS